MKKVIAISLCCIASQTYALEKGVFIGGNIGRSDIELDRNFQDERDSHNAAAIGLSAGYMFENNIVTQINATGSENISILGAIDRHNLQHADLSFGYQFSWERLRITPAIGIAKWELNSEEGQFLNPGPEVKAKLSGEDPLIGLSVGITFGRIFQMNVTRKSVNAGFGHYHQSQVDFLFHIGDF